MISEKNDSELENFLYNVSWLRKHHGISKRNMAKLMGISVMSLNKIEKGKMPPQLSVAALFNIYRHFGIHPKDQFMRRLGEQQTD